MHEYKVGVERDGRWWMIYVPEIEGVTQARRVDEIEEMARSLIAVSTDTPLAEIAVHVVCIKVSGVDIAESANRVEELRRQADDLQAQAAEAAKQFARALTREGVPVRDAATLLHVSPQRISQLAKAG